LSGEQRAGRRLQRRGHVGLLEPGHARVVRDDAPLAVSTGGDHGRELAVSLVDPGAGEEWIDLLVGVYRVDAGPWLEALHGRPGWRHYLAREDGRPVAARSMYLPGLSAIAFLAVDGPCPA
jgi:hypothetical protein